MKVTISGASDDLCEMDGDIYEEWCNDASRQGFRLSFSDGTVIEVIYGDDGLWRVARTVEGTATYTHKFTATDPDSEHYSDRASLEGDFTFKGCAKFRLPPKEERNG